MTRIFPMVFLLVSCTGIWAQQAKPSAKAEIADAIAAYFDYDRESIHVHFNKSVFFSSEQIWFKGYVYNKKNDTPFFETTNVFAVLYDQSGNTLDEQLLFSYIGAFSGSVKLGSELESGRYYIRFYTNWMNNFKENESSIYAVDVINTADTKMVDYTTPDYSSIKIGLYPEGGNLVEGVMNNLGIDVRDCNGNPIEAKGGRIVNSQKETVANFIIGKSGLGKVYITPTAETYAAVMEIDGKTIETILPKASISGLTLEVNNYALPGKTIVKLRTRAQNLPLLTNKPLYIVISQANKSNIIETSFTDKAERELAIPNDNLYKGVNVIRVIDENMRLLAERHIIQYPDTRSQVSFPITAQAGGNVKLYGISDFPNADISISVLPENSRAAATNDIYGDLLIAPYTGEKNRYVAGLLSEPTKAKRYELDLLLLNRKTGKYNWDDIVAGPTKPTYDFDVGLAVKGTINQPISDPKKYRMQLSAPMSLINDYSEINAKNEFEFKNLVFGDLASFRFTLLRIPSVPTQMKFYHQILNRKRPFNKPFHLEPNSCSETRFVPITAPVFGKDVIELENIDVVAKSKTELKYKNKFGNGNLRGYKVTDTDHGDLLSYIAQSGFKVSRTAGRVTITGKQVGTLNAAPSTPDVYVNGRSLMSYDELDMVTMDEVDEIYLNAHAIVASMNNKMGVIKIYMKKMGFGGANTHTQTHEIKQGFSMPKPFENSVSSTLGQGFRDFGVVQWIPTVLTDEKGEFSFEIPRTGLKTVNVHIEGITPDGQIISEVRTVAVE